MFHPLRIFIALAVVLFATSGAAVAQSTNDQDWAKKRALEMIRAHEVPEATLPCTPDEAQWWNDLRAAGKAVNASGGRRQEREKFIALLKEGRDKSYQVPIPDGGARFLWKSEPLYTDEARNKLIKGSIAMVVELLPDGTVGEARIVQALDPGLDRNAQEAARRTVFLPKIKDRKFVVSFVPMTMSFDVY